LLAVAVALVALAGCGESPEDEARDDGKQVGEAVRAIGDATSLEAAQAAVADLRTTIQDLDSETRERVQEQVETQGDELSKGIDAITEAGSFEEAQSELQSSAQDLRAQADSFRSGTNSIANEFWRGFEEGYDGD
jgi:hypothetical protein